LVAVWEPNNYTKSTRKKTLKVKAAQAAEVDFRKKDEGREDDILVRWVPTPPDIVDEMCKLGKVDKEDTVFDLGCGDGIMVIRAVKNFGAKKGVGVDIDPNKVKDAKAAGKAAGVSDRLEFREGDVLKPIEGLADASVVLLYMGDDLNNALKPQLLKTLKPGSRVVSHRFTMGDWKPEKTLTVKGNDGDDYQIHLWIIPEKKGE
jgi:SAM-dependent methyltransferase